MPAFSFEVENPNGKSTEYLTRGSALTAEEAVERVFERYPEGRIKRQLYGGDTSDVDFANPNFSDETSDAAADEEHEDELMEALADEPEDDESMIPPPIDPTAFTVSEMRSELAERDLSKPQLRGLKISEEGGENRVTVIREIDERLSSNDE
jgi:hypothetical protein